MELLIRSQDKRLLCKFDSLFIEEGLYKRKGKYIIMANNGWLGEYDTLERALEILDEIQKKYNSINLGHDFGSPMIDLKNPGYVYQMPKD